MLADTADATRDSPIAGAGRIGAHRRLLGLGGDVARDSCRRARRVPIGHAGDGGPMLPDERLSRSHFSVSHSDDGWVVRDLGSRNGTFVDGRAIEGECVAVSPRTIRAADTLVIPCNNLAGFRAVTGEEGLVVGWRMQEALAAVNRAAAASTTLLLSGESGTGKEVAARRFHPKGPNAQGPFVALNCATIPPGLAERLLFGATRGAYSGADADAAGHVRAADGGVLFLDEYGKLDPGVQAKLLRVIETQEYVALGATRPTQIAIRVCAATHMQLRRAVADGRFRSDLYHRIAPPEVVLPPLRARLDGIPHHVAREVARAAPGLSPHVRLVEACILLQWPGNVRELSRHVRGEPRASPWPSEPAACGPSTWRPRPVRPRVGA